MVIYLSEIKLRPYQQRFIDDVRDQMSKNLEELEKVNKQQKEHTILEKIAIEKKKKLKNICGVAPCGAGKTIITGWMARETAQNGKRVLFMVHRKELIDQTSKTFNDLGIEHGIIASGVIPNYKPLVQIASVQTLVRRLDEVPLPNLLIVDECHHVLAKSYLKIVKRWNPWILGVTATPVRLGGITLSDVFYSMVNGPSIGTLIKNKHLTNVAYFTTKTALDTSKLRSKFGEYIEKDMLNLMDKPSVINDVIKYYKQYANGKQTIVYCVNIAHSKHTADMFNRAGIKAAHVDGETKKVERNKIINDFRDGKITVLCNARLLGEGFDVPNCDCVILNRPTQSMTVYIQQSMRCMRPDPNNPYKVAIIIDHVENIKRFGPVDIDRNWSLNPNKFKSPMPAPTKICPECGREVYLATRECPHCKHEFENDENKEEFRSIIKCFDTRDKDYSKERTENLIIRPPTFKELLEKYFNEAIKKEHKPIWIFYKLYDFVESLEDLQLIAEKVHYKKGWAWYQWQNKLNGVTLKELQKNNKIN